MKTEQEDLLRVETTDFVLPQHLNHMGNMHGGEIMKLMDNTAGLVCSRYSGGDAVTAAVNDFKFIKPVPKGSIIKCVAEIKSVGTTSMKALVQVFVEEVKMQKIYLAAEGIFVGVAVDLNGKPRPVGKVMPV